MSERHLVFAPHPDDEQIGCAAVLVRANRAGEAVRVVIITAGQNLLAVCAGITTDPTPAEVGRRREAESLRSCRLLGLADEQVVFLGHVDGAVERDADRIADDCRRQIVDFQPTRIYCTSQWDGHPDHRAALHAVAAARTASGSHAPLWQYSRRETFDQAGQPYAAVDIGDVYDLKREALAYGACHLEVISPHQQQPVMPDFLEQFCRREECFAPFEG